MTSCHCLLIFKNYIMKTLKSIKTIAFLFCLTIGTQSFNAQNKAQKYSDTVTDNPTAEADLKTVSDFTYALVNNDLSKAENLLAENFMSYGPLENTTQTKKELIAEWTRVHKARTNQKIEFVMITFKVIEGNLKGNWVSQWGTYTFTQNGKNIVLPYQCTARIANGKIVETRFYYDNLPVIKAMGYEIKAAEQN